MTSSEKNKYSFYNVSLTTLYIVFGIIYFYYLITGSSFYFTEIIQRPHHADYRMLRPAGLLGHGFGVIGSLLMILMLGYSIRKRSRIFGNAGHLTHWLGFHIFCGIAGPLLIILHSSFKVQGLIAVSFWSMIAVATSGILGRYIYIQIPRTISGKEVDRNELQGENDRISLELKSEFELDDSDLEQIENWYGSKSGQSGNLISMLIRMITADILRPLSR